jgi:HD-GYP domain-containing protein (c-di-GMP phosphodiesterase class II)
VEVATTVDAWSDPGDPDTDSLVEESRARVSRRLFGKEFLVTLAVGGAFATALAGLIVWSPDEQGVRFGITAGLVLAYAAAARVSFEVGFAHVVPTQLVFVPMLFLVPLQLVPACVAIGFFASRLPEHLRGSLHPGRVGLHLVSASYALGPVLVLAAADVVAPTASALPLLAAALAAQFTCDFAASAARGLALGVSPMQLAKALGPAWAVDAALTPLGFALAYVAWHIDFAFLLGLPLMALLAYFARERRKRIDHALELSHAYRGTALLLGDVVEADDAYTGFHSHDVVSLVLSVADHLGVDSRTRRDAELTALLHDVGKVRIPKEIINKNGSLTEDEWAIIKTHTIEGQHMLEKVGGLLGAVGLLVRSCHERWDGRGYPDGLEGDAIPLVSRIVCVCDAFSAMTTDRPYRKALGSVEALGELGRCAGGQFDPKVVEALFAVADAPRPTLLDAAA